jgi:hypothetical protein
MRCVATVVAAMGALLVASGAAAQPEPSAGDGESGWSWMMSGPMAACPMGASATSLRGRFMMGPGMMGGPEMMMGDVRGWNADSVDAQLDDLNSELAITPDQEDAWNAYAAAARADAQVTASMRATMASFMEHAATTTAPAWLDAHRTMMRTRADSLDALATAADALYAALDDLQKTTFDRVGGGLCGAW